jgi:hypothetical protein
MKHGDQSGHQGCKASTGEGFARKAGNYLLFLSVKRDRPWKSVREERQVVQESEDL